MAWDVAPPPAVDGVRLRYADAPEWEVVITGVPELARHLESAGKRVIPVQFEVTCGWTPGGRVEQFFREVTVDGVEVPVSAGGWAGRRGDGRSLDPLAAACS